jgi:hypothetical protein
MGKRAVGVYRANYWDNFFRFRYDLPVSKTFSWTFEEELQQRKYPADDPRGYSMLRMNTIGKITIDKRTRGRIGHTYIYNDENTRSKAHKNHKYNAMWERKYSDSFKLKVEDIYHYRDGISNNDMDFRENLLAAKATWKLPSRIMLNWGNEYLTRVYAGVRPATTQYRDFRYFQTALSASYMKAKQFDWQIEQKYRTFSYRNPANTPDGWNTVGQPMTEAIYNFFLRSDLKVKLKASQEKTFYKTFDQFAQELLWNFTQPLRITEFYGGLEYDF